MRAERRSVCPLACTLDLIGDRWTLLVVRDLARGLSTFKDFSSSPERIATNILADRLARLVTHGLAEKRSSAAHPGRDEYRLTRKGKSLVPVASAISAWGLAHIEGTSARLKPTN